MRVCGGVRGGGGKVKGGGNREGSGGGGGAGLRRIKPRLLDKGVTSKLAVVVVVVAHSAAQWHGACIAR
jgi:hypothetical protein